MEGCLALAKDRDRGLTLCSSCKARPAVYLRRASGHPLCRRCLEDVVARSAKRAARGLDVFRPGMTLAVYVAALDPIAAVTLAFVMGRVEEAYKGRVVALVPDYVIIEESVEKALRERGVEISYSSLENVIGRSMSGKMWAPALLRVERGLAARQARDVGASVAMLPLTRSMISIIGVESLLSGALEYMIDLDASALEAQGVKIVYGLRLVESEAVRALALLHGLYNVESKVIPEFRFKNVYLSIASAGRPELEYSSVSSISLIAGELSRDKSLRGRCRACGAPIAGGKYCKDCGRLWR